ncbi:Major facilitator superfamily domain, general substrate transporter [Pleurostoma richardsiae]|uniref:Major facilitator superfamily domain, general substrate transporter n=1 Tax=Pleurostoma richardsiae TaxID=41990 RepID=A0AA38R6W5_9PEZI|nr:Major facilitator superfamily domain, general substrate transporter [Pleurostoma richardsiae]
MAEPTSTPRDDVESAEKGAWVSASKSSDSGATDEEVHPLPMSIDIDPVAERKLLWKFDLRILPILAVMYLFNGLDKGNMGNAKTAGLETDLKLHGDQYNILLSVFFIPYVLSAPFVGIVGKKFGPSRVLPLMMLLYGSMTLLTAAAKNFGGLFAIRWFVGMGESAFFPLVIYYQTTFYRRGELARRLALFYAASNIANAFSGLLAFGTFHIKGGSIATWKYLFIVEGAGTVLVAIFAFFYLPLNGATAHFLNDDEKKLAHHRLQIDSSSIVNEKFEFREAMGIFRHPTSWMILIIEMCLGVPLQSVNLYLPVIIKRLGYSTVKTNLFTVAPNVTGAVMLLLLAFTSDFTRLRFPFVALGFAFTLTGFVIYACVNVTTQLHVSYFACFMMTWGTAAPSVILDVWYNNNIANENRRVMLTSVGVPAANIMGLVSSNIFQNKDAPKYFPALITTACFGAVGCVLTLLLGAWMIIDNKRRDAREGRTVKAKEIPTELLADGPENPRYRWHL